MHDVREKELFISGWVFLWVVLYRIGVFWDLGLGVVRVMGYDVGCYTAETARSLC